MLSINCFENPGRWKPPLGMCKYTAGAGKGEEEQVGRSVKKIRSGVFRLLKFENYLANTLYMFSIKTGNIVLSPLQFICQL